jgi:hypothetical protein
MDSSNGSGEGDDNDLTDSSQDQEIEIVVNNVVASFALGCKLDLRKIAKEAPHVIYKRDQAVSVFDHGRQSTFLSARWY